MKIAQEFCQELLSFFRSFHNFFVVNKGISGTTKIRMNTMDEVEMSWTEKDFDDYVSIIAEHILWMKENYTDSPIVLEYFGQASGC